MFFLEALRLQRRRRPLPLGGWRGGRRDAEGLECRHGVSRNVWILVGGGPAKSVDDRVAAFRNMRGTVFANTRSVNTGGLDSHLARAARQRL
jgi:hypothetical protein